MKHDGHFVADCAVRPNLVVVSTPSLAFSPVPRVMNQFVFKHSARNLPFIDSMKALSVGAWTAAASSQRPIDVMMLARELAPSGSDGAGHSVERASCGENFRRLAKATTTWPRQRD
jgi:hypothetical protein